MSDLVERLRGDGETLSAVYDKRERDSVSVVVDEELLFNAICRMDEAADRIEALEQERDEARNTATVAVKQCLDDAEAHEAEASRLRAALDASHATLSDIRTFLVREFGTVDTEVNGVVGWIDEAIGPVEPVHRAALEKP